MPSVGHAWHASDRVAHGVKLTRANQHDTSTLKGMYLTMLLRALTGGLEAPGQSEPLAHPETGARTNVVRKFKNETAVLIWDGYQRAMETGKVLEHVLDSNVGGAVVEVGVFRGGMSAYMQGILLARHMQPPPPQPANLPPSATHAAADDLRRLWLVDSFEGLPDSSGMTSRNKIAKGDSQFSRQFNSAAETQSRWAGDLSVGESTVFATFERFGLLDHGNVHALRGFVNDSLPKWPKSRRIALLRVDVDIYAPTYDTLHYLYYRLSPGGVVLFDDWKYAYAREAIMDFRRDHNITAPIRFLPGTYDPMAYWFHCPRKPAGKGGRRRLPETCRDRLPAQRIEPPVGQPGPVVTSPLD